MNGKVTVGLTGGELVHQEGFRGGLLGSALASPGVRFFAGNGPANLWLARAEVRAALAANGGAVPQSPAPPDALRPDGIPSVACGMVGDRVLAEIDQDGFAFATHRLDEPFFNRRSEYHPRQRNLLDIVLFQGRVCVRKRFRAFKRGARVWGRYAAPASQWIPRAVWTSLRFFLYAEAASMLRLGDLPFVPKLRHIDFAENALYIDFVSGESLRHRAARSGAAVYDTDLAGFTELASLTSRQLDRREVDLLDRIGDGDFRAEIAAMAAQINHRGVAPLDIKLGNFVRGSETGQLYWLDFEISRLESQPRWQEDLLLQRELLDHLLRREDRRVLELRRAVG
jgi:hypothetical protein